MIDPIGVPVIDIASSRTFYEIALAPPDIRTPRVETNGLGNMAGHDGEGRGLRSGGMR